MLHSSHHAMKMTYTWLSRSHVHNLPFPGHVLHDEYTRIQSFQFHFQAIKIMRHALVKHGSYERFEESSGGRKLSRIQILDYVRNYLKQENMENEVQVWINDYSLNGKHLRAKGIA